MSVEPIGGDLASLPLEYLELHEMVKAIPPVSWYPQPVESLRATLLHRFPNNPVGDPAFLYLCSFIKQRTPTVELLNDIRGLSDHYTPKRFTEWMRQMDELYYPVLDLLQAHAQATSLRYRELYGKLDDLTQNIIRSLSPDAAAFHQEPSGLSPEEEMIIALTCAKLSTLPTVFPHSPLLTPDHFAGHWSRFIKEETVECLLHHGHSRKVIETVLTSGTFKDATGLRILLDFEVPSMANGAL